MRKTYLLQKRCPSFFKTMPFLFQNEGLPFLKRCPSFSETQAAGLRVEVLKTWQLLGKVGKKAYLCRIIATA